MGLDPISWALIGAAVTVGTAGGVAGKQMMDTMGVDAPEIPTPLTPKSLIDKSMAQAQSLLQTKRKGRSALRVDPPGQDIASMAGLRIT